MSNPYPPGAPLAPYPAPQRDVRALARGYGICNLVLASFAALWVVLMSAVALYGIFLSGDPREEIVIGVVGCAVLGGPALIGMIIYLVAGYGLLRGRRWGAMMHLIGAILSAFSCIGAIYTAIAMVHISELMNRTRESTPPPHVKKHS